MDDERPLAGWRVRHGFTFFVVSIGWPVVIPLLLLLGVPTATTAALSGVMIVAAEIMLIAGAAIAGKEGFTVIKATVFGFLKSYGQPREVSRLRYNIGLVMFATPFVFGWPLPTGRQHKRLIRFSWVTNPKPRSHISIKTADQTNGAICLI